MDLLNSKNNIGDRMSKSEIIAPRQNEFTLIGKMRHQRGLTLFEINKVTGDIKVAEMDVELRLDRNANDVVKNRKVVVKKDCFYLEALNKKNAKRKYENLTRR